MFAEDEAAVLVDAAEHEGHLEELARRRASGEPLEQVVGWASFCGLRVAVEPGVFVPRLRTSLLVDLAVSAAPRGGVVVDLCCGSGAVAAAVAHARPDLAVYAADSDPAAVRCARRNLPEDTVFEGDLFEALPRSLRGRVDVLAVNAPYVPTAEIAMMPTEARDHEARAALDGGPDGLDVHRRVTAGAPGWLSAAGVLVVETSVRQAWGTVEACRRAGMAGDVRRSEEYDATAVVAQNATDGCA